MGTGFPAIVPITVLTSTNTFSKAALSSQKLLNLLLTIRIGSLHFIFNFLILGYLANCLARQNLLGDSNNSETEVYIIVCSLHHKLCLT